MNAHQNITSESCGCEQVTKPKSMISIEQALERIVADTGAVPETEQIDLGAARGRFLSEPVRARSMTPPFDNAAMDGYAIATRSLSGEGPWTLPVSDRIAAGQAPDAPLAAGAAARIFTGAPVPAGADAVIMQEAVRRSGAAITIDRRPAPGLNVRTAGSDMGAGQTVLDSGCSLGVRQIAVLAAAGAGSVQVRRRLRVGLIVTGDEVQRPGGERDGAQIWDINTPMLAASLTGPAIELVAVSHGADRREALARQLADIAVRSDLVVTTGGISVGEEDHVKPALAGLGAEIIFSGVAIKPGKPVSVGRLGRTMWLGLPGNPLSAFVTWHLFGTALVRGLCGQTPATPPRERVVTAAAINHKPGRCELRPAMLAGLDGEGRRMVSFDDATHSGRVLALHQADGLIVLPADSEHLPAGTRLEFHSFCDS